MLKTNNVKNSFGSFFTFLFLLIITMVVSAIVTTVGAEPFLPESFSVKEKKEFIEVEGTGIYRK